MAFPAVWTSLWVSEKEEKNTMVTPQTAYETAGQGMLIETPKLLNTFDDDDVLQSLLKRILPLTAYKSIEPDLKNLGKKCATNYLEIANEAEFYKPQFEKYDAFGNNINKLITSSAWKKQHDIASIEGVVGLGYKYNKFSLNLKKKYWRIYQYTKLLLWQQSSGLYSCPIAMTDGAAKLLSIICKSKEKNNQIPIQSINKNISDLNMNKLFIAYQNLISFDKNKFWTSGQWMTERGGGSDVTQNGTNTIAKQQNYNSDKYKLFGYKWFSSATDANISITLARIEKYNDNKIISGNKGVSCFYIPNIQKNNNIEIIKLKNKLGTRQLPTAELQLNGTNGILLSKNGKGIQTIMILANITRIHNAISSCGAIKRTLALIRGYAKNRNVFNKKLYKIPLHQKTMANLDILYRVCLYFTMECIQLLGKSEHELNNKIKNNSDLLLRLLTPLCKLYTAKCAVYCSSEGIECMGGIGYLETTNMPRIYRDAQVLPVWEGTTNVLSLDVLRVLNHKLYGKQTWNLYHKRIINIIKLNINHTGTLNKQYNLLQKFMIKYGGNSRLCELYARDIAFSMFRIYAACLLFEHAFYTKMDIDMDVYKKFVNGNMQCSFIGGDCGKCLVSQSLINLMEEKVDDKQYGKHLRFLSELGMGKFSKL